MPEEILPDAVAVLDPKEQIVIIHSTIFVAVELGLN